MGFRSGEFAGQSSTPTYLTTFLVLLAVWAGAKSYWKMKSVSLKIGQQKEALSAPKVGAVTLVFKKHNGPTPADDIAPKISNRLWKLQATWAMSFSTLPPEKRTLDHWVTVQFFFSLAQVRRLCRQL